MDPSNDHSLILEAENLSKSFLQPHHRKIFANISLKAHASNTIAIMGPSGSGKTTLLHILGTLEAPTTGSLIIAGHNVLKGEQATTRNKHIGFIFQNYNLLEDYSVIENVLMPTRIGTQRSSHIARAQELLHLVELDTLMDLPAKHLSGGEKQRVSIARALINDPTLILADEPTGNLDENTSANIQNLLINTAKTLNKALIVVTHNHTFAQKCDQQYTLTEHALQNI